MKSTRYKITMNLRGQLRNARKGMGAETVIKIALVLLILAMAGLAVAQLLAKVFR